MKSFYQVLSAFLLLSALLPTAGLQARRGDDWQRVVCISNNNGLAVFKTDGASHKREDAGHDAKCRLFYALLFVGVEGVEDGKPLVQTEDNPMFTDAYFNGSQKYESSVISTKGVDDFRRSDGRYRGTAIVTVSLPQLIAQLERDKLRSPQARTSAGSTGKQMPTIMVVPYRKAGESYYRMFQTDYDLRRAVACVQDGFQQRDVQTIDFEARYRSTDRSDAYNREAATSADAELLKSAGTDVYVEVDINKYHEQQGNRVSLVLKAYETATGIILASKNASTRTLPKASVDELCRAAVTMHLSDFLDDICAHWTGKKAANESPRVTLEFGFDGASMRSFDDPVGSKGLKLSFLINQWVRQHAFRQQYQLRGVVDTKLIYDSVSIPPTDADGFAMDPMAFSYLIETYLQNELGLEARSRIEGRKIMITIF